MLALGFYFMSRLMEGQRQKGPAEFLRVRLGVVLRDDPHSVSTGRAASPLLLVLGLVRSDPEASHSSPRLFLDREIYHRRVRHRLIAIIITMTNMPTIRSTHQI